MFCHLVSIREVMLGIGIAALGYVWVFFSNSDAQLPRLETYFFASFSVKTGFCNNSICSVILP